MKIILKENIPSLGYKDDVVEVKDGYGRNYLIPQGLAIIASEAALKRRAEDQKQRAHKLEKIKADAQSVAEKLAAVKALVITVKASEDGRIYGSVTNIQLAEALAAAGVEIERKLIDLKSVKALGDHTATVKLHREVSVEVPFTVVAEGAPAAEAAPAAAEEAPAAE